ncbi:MAG: adenylate cyclase [Ignavibacteria bacterium]|nr:adenylate cyclase [Ignavibacteria bacterium]
MRSLSNGLFTGNVVLVVAAYSSYMLFKKFRQEFIMTKRMEEERRKAEELNAQLGEANEEINQQLDILNEQAREIELSNITLQEQYLTIEQDRKELAESNALLDAAHEQSETLLLNILPAPIAHRLKSGERAIADRFDSVTVLFADIVGFTKLSARTSPEELVQGLNGIFERFDALANKYGLEKIKTIGDAYMVAGGLPERIPDHAERVALFALDILVVMQDEALRTQSGEQVKLRIGIHTGEAVAGVIGTSKFSYDIWGDTVNTASRMESHSDAGKIHVSEEVFEALKEKFVFEERGEMEVKGKGVMRTWFLVGAQR